MFCFVYSACVGVRVVCVCVECVCCLRGPGTALTITRCHSRYYYNSNHYDGKPVGRPTLSGRIINITAPSTPIVLRIATHAAARGEKSFFGNSNFATESRGCAVSFSSLRVCRLGPRRRPQIRVGGHQDCERYGLVRIAARNVQFVYECSIEKSKWVAL